ncbi:MAG TPA: PAS domain-containing sensor histidine kinase [Longimicrobiales bacterium]|nr:PAS domain-containing sensor histidine kinase [Longimicrobiales bacterium]
MRPNEVAALLVSLDREGHILEWNRACSDLTGYSQDEARGRHVWDFLLVPDEQDAVRSEFARIQRAGSASTFENYWVAKDGSRRWIRWSSSASLRPDGEIHVVATGLDETERKEACERLRISEAKLRGILAITADAVISVDQEQRILLFSKGAERVFGWTRDEALGRSLDLLIPERFREVHREHVGELAAAPDSDRQMGEIVGVRKNGDEFPAEAAVSKLGTDQGPLLTVTLRDVSDRKELELSLRREIQHREELTRTIVHELRSPLNAIALEAELLLRSRDTPAYVVPDRFERMKTSALKMARLLDDLLDATCIEAGRLSVHKSPFPIAKLLDEAVQTARTQASTKGVVVRAEISGELPLAEADPRRVAQVLDNLISNALKFTPDGGLVTVSAEEHSEEVRVRVRDSGPGIAVEQVDHVFEPFWQADPGDRRGAGLGLAIAKGIVEAHQGRIWVETGSGSGTTLSFTLPKALRLAEQGA